MDDFGMMRNSLFRYKIKNHFIKNLYKTIKLLPIDKTTMLRVSKSLVGFDYFRSTIVISNFDGEN